MKSRIENYSLNEEIHISKLRKIFTYTELEEAFEMLTDYLSQEGYIPNASYQKHWFYDMYPTFMQERDGLYGFLLPTKRSGLFDIPESFEVYVTLHYKPYEVDYPKYFPKVVDGELLISASLNMRSLPMISEPDIGPVDLVYEKYLDVPKGDKARLAKFLRTVESFVKFYREIKQVRIGKDRRSVARYKKMIKSRPNEFRFDAYNSKLAKIWKIKN